MINITNRVARLRWQAEMDRLMVRLERPFYREIKSILGRQYLNAVELVSVGMLNDTDHAVNLERDRMVRAFQKHYKRVVTAFGKKAYGIIEKLEPKPPVKSLLLSEGGFVGTPEIKSPKDEFLRALDHWTTFQTANKVRQVQETTKKSIARIVKKGMSEGESHKDIAKRIRKTSSKINTYRSIKIARTETHTAAVKSVDVAVGSTRIEMEREWVSARDARTRRRGKHGIFEHFAKYPTGPDGERVAQDGKFVGTGESLDFPGDPKGSAGNIINCRCVLMYHTVKKTEEVAPTTPELPPGEFAPAKSFGEAERRFKNHGIGKVYNPGIKESRWTKEKAFLDNAANPVLEEVERLGAQFPEMMDALNKDPLWNLELFRGSSLPEVVSDHYGTMAHYQKSGRTIRMAMTDLARKSKPTLSVGEGAFSVGKEFRNNLRHEMGHHMFDVVLRRKRSHFVKIWRDVGKRPDGTWDVGLIKRFFDKNVSRYAATSVDEAFAECFSAYTSPLYKRRMLPEQIEEFFDDILGVKKVKAPKWKPVMTETEADEWAKGSKVKTTVYHGTSKGAADKIQKEGFKLGMPSAGGKFMGDGIYVATSQEVADEFVELFKLKGAELLKIKVNVKNPFVIKDRKHLVELVDELEKAGYEKTFANIPKYLKSKGYDALDGTRVSRDYGINVFDPINVVVVK